MVKISRNSIIMRRIAKELKEGFEPPEDPKTLTAMTDVQVKLETRIIDSLVHPWMSGENRLFSRLRNSHRIHQNRH